MKLITEEIEQCKILVEEKEGKKHMYIEGVFLQGNLKNRNNRMYPVEILEKEVNRYTESFISKGRALGELGHPEDLLLIWIEFLTKLLLFKERVIIL